MKMLVLAILSALLLVAAACGDDDDGGAGRLTNPDIRGVVTNASAGCSEDVPGVFLVEGELEADTTYTRASVNVQGAKTYRVDGGDLVEIEPCDLALGETVEIWFDGPVAESDPVQAKAGTIYVIS